MRATSKLLLSLPVLALLASQPHLASAEIEYVGPTERALQALEAGNTAKAISLLEGRAKNGNAQSQYILGIAALQVGEADVARMWWERAAKNGLASASHALADSVLDGKIPASTAERERILRDAARANHFRSTMQLISDALKANRGEDAAYWVTLAEHSRKVALSVLTGNVAHLSGPEFFLSEQDIAEAEKVYRNSISDLPDERRKTRASSLRVELDKVQEAREMALSLVPEADWERGAKRAEEWLKRTSRDGGSEEQKPHQGGSGYSTPYSDEGQKGG